MAILKPFPALRPDPAKAAQICAPPYDVLNTEEARAMADGNPLSFLRVSKPEIELAADVDPYSKAVYEHGAANLRRLIGGGSLIQDEKPCYYLYRLVMGEHSQLGLVAAASCAEYDTGVIKKHELTRPDKEDDRMRHINILGSQTGPVFLTYRAQPNIDSLFAAQTERDPDYDYVADDGIRHTAWVINDDTVIAQIEAAFVSVPALYVADGHHRSAAASRVAKERAAANPDHTGDEAYNYFLTVTFPDNQMQILGYNRAVKDLNGKDAAAVLEEIAKVADITPAPENHRPRCKSEVTMYIDGKWHLLTWKSEIANSGNSVDRLDVSILQQKILTPVLNIGNPRTDKRITFVGGIRGTGELSKLVNSGEWAIAFALFPTSIGELIAIADEDGLMPPKSTWFEPKLRDAMFCHMI